MAIILGKRYKNIHDRQTDCQSRARTLRRVIEREARRKQPKQAHPKTTKGFATN